MLEHGDLLDVDLYASIVASWSRRSQGLRSPESGPRASAVGDLRQFVR
jgi:hypothetical protein